MKDVTARMLMERERFERPEQLLAVLPVDRPECIDERTWLVMTQRLRGRMAFNTLSQQIGVSSERVRQLYVRGRARLIRKILAAEVVA